MRGDQSTEQASALRLRRPRAREWHRLAALTAAEFAELGHSKALNRVRSARRALLWFEAMAEMAGGMGWTDERGQALVMLGPPGLLIRRPRKWLVALPTSLVLAAVIVAAGALAWPLALVLVTVVLVAMFDPPQLPRLRAYSCNAELRGRRPHGSYSLHGLVRDPAAPGAGWRLVEALCDRADVEGWVLCLDAGGASLPGYYARLGFVPSGPAVAMPWGEMMTSMVRRPNADDAGTPSS